MTTTLPRSLLLSLLAPLSLVHAQSGVDVAGHGVDLTGSVPPALAPWDCRATMPKGTHFAGKPIDFSERRSAEIVSKTSDKLIIRNYRRENAWWTVSVDPKCIQEAQWLEEDFQVLGRAVKKIPIVGDLLPNMRGVMGHSMMRYPLKPGCRATLEPQDPKDAKLGRREIDDFVFSIDGVGIQGFKGVSPLKGLFNHYALAHRLTSGDEKDALAVGKLKRKIIPLPLKLSAEESQHLFLTQLQEANDYGERLCNQDPRRDNLDLMYHTATRNCTSEIYRILFKAFPEKFADDKLLKDLIAKSGNMRPLDAAQVLGDLGLLDKQKAKATAAWTEKNRPFFHTSVLK